MLCVLFLKSKIDWKGYYSDEFLKLPVAYKKCSRLLDFMLLISNKKQVIKSFSFLKQTQNYQTYWSESKVCVDCIMKTQTKNASSVFLALQKQQGFSLDAKIQGWLKTTLRQNQVNFLVYGQDSKNVGSVGRQNKNNTIWFLGPDFLKKNYFA